MGKIKSTKVSKGKQKEKKIIAKQVVRGVHKVKKKKPWRAKNSDQQEKHKVTRPTTTTKKSKKDVKKESLREKMMKRLNAARFRQLNEELDSASHDDPQEAFGSQAENFKKYHEAYKERKEQWEVDPLDVIISWIQKNFPPPKVIADFGCGEARLAASVPNTVHSFDLFALNDRVTACDMSKCPLNNGTVDVAVFCLSLMGTDVGKFIVEANRVLKNRGILKIAEVASRFQETGPAVFMKKMKKFGFVPSSVDPEEAEAQNASQKSDIFYMFEFRKVRPVREVRGKYPALKLNPSLYKKR